MKYTVVLEPQEKGGFTVRCLELPGAISQGETRREAIKNIKEAICLISDVLREDLAFVSLCLCGDRRATDCHKDTIAHN